LREYFVSGCGAFLQQYLMYCKKAQQNPGAKFPQSAEDAMVWYCLQTNSFTPSGVSRLNTILLLVVSIISVVEDPSSFS